jgi:hypothetical protein
MGYSLSKPPSWEELGLTPRPAPTHQAFWNNRRRRALAHCASEVIQNDPELSNDIQRWRIMAARYWNETYAREDPAERITSESIRGQRQQGGWFREVMTELAKRAVVSRLSFFTTGGPTETKCESLSFSYPFDWDEIKAAVERGCQCGSNPHELTIVWRKQNES